jgi:hypothetical protein
MKKDLLRFLKLITLLCLIQNQICDVSLSNSLSPTDQGKKQLSLISDFTQNDKVQKNPELPTPIIPATASPSPNQNKVENTSSVVPLRDKTIIELDQLYSLQEKGMVLNIENRLGENTYYVIEAKGIGNLEFEFCDKETDKRILIGAYFLTASTDFSYIPFDEISEDDDVKRVLKIRKVGMVSNEILIKVRKVKYLEMDFNSSFKIITTFCTHVTIKVKNPKKYITANKINRLQFLLQTGSTGSHQAMEGEELLDMYINKSDKFPQPDEFDMQASGSLGTGLVKTISRNNKFYCIEDGCEYNVTLLVLGIKEITFFPTIFANGSTIKFHNNMFLIEELEPNEIVSYVLEVPQIEGNWVFSITPSENNPKFFINPDRMPENLEDYLYKGTALGPQEIIITNLESKIFGFSYTKFYVTYASSDPSLITTFRFEANRFDHTQRKYLRPNFYESGLAAQNEVINYFIQIKSDEPESHSINLQLNTVSGLGELFVKECLEGENNCQITEEDVHNSYLPDFQKFYQNRIFRFSKNTPTHDSSAVNEILLNFNCIGRTGAFTDEMIRNYPNSNSCIFALGVYNKESPVTGLPYGLLTKGLTIIKTLLPRTSTNVIVTRKEKSYFEIPLPNVQNRGNFKFLKIKVVALTGSCDIYLSKYNENPNKDDFETVIKIDKRDYVSLHSKTFEQFMFFGEFNGDHLFMGVEGKTYSVMDVYVEFTVDDSPSNKVEYLKGQNIIHRTIEKDSGIVNEKNELIYHEDFAFRFSQYSANFEFIQIKIDGHAFGMEICVQKNIEKVDQSRKCDFSSNSEQLKITKDPTLFREGNILGISIRMKSKFSGFLNFPINFSILIENDDKMGKFTLHRPGFVHTREISENASYVYQLDVSNMSFRTLVVFTTESSNLECLLSYTRNYQDNVTTLGHENFAYEFKNVKNFKEKHCKARSCFIYAIVSNKGDKKEKFSISYTIDGNPFVLKEGEELFVPSAIPIYFTFNHIELDQPVHFNFSSEVTSLVAYSSILPKVGEILNKPFMYLNEEKFDYKSNIDRNAQMVINLKDQKNYTDSIIMFYTVPKFDFLDLSREKESIEFDKTALLRVIAHTGIQKLTAFHQTESSVYKGDIKDFSINISPPKKFSIFLSLSAGDADLYINPGHYNLTTTKHYWKKSSVKDGDELVIDESMFDTKMPEDFTVGVRGNETSAFSLIYSPDSRNIMRLKYQSLTDIKLKKDELYYFDFFNKLNNFNSILYAADSDVDVSVLEYGKTKNDNFYEVIKNDSNYLQHFTFKKGDIPRKKFSEVPLDIESHYVIRMKAIDADTDVNFIIYDKNKPIHTRSDKRFHFALDKEDIQIFCVQLDTEYREVDVDFKLSFGNVEFAVSDNMDRFDNFTKVEKPSQKYKTVFVDNKNLKKSNDIVLFKEIFIKVKSWEFSKFSILVKPVDKFKQLHSNESELIYTNPDKDIYLYYNVSKTKLKSTMLLNFDIYTEQYYTAKPELLFIPEQDISLSKDSAFIPMNVIDYFEASSGEQRHIIIKPKITVGNFIIKIAKQSKIVPLKILVSINNVRHIEVNGYYKDKIPPSKMFVQEYSMFLPSAGEFRILPDTCSNMEIKNAVFFENNKKNEIVFEDKYYQSYDFITIDESKESIERTLRLMELPVRRGLVNSDGVLKFKVIRKNESFTEEQQSDQYLLKNDYFLISEFRPDNKELIMKDYVNLWGTKDGFAHIQFKHTYQSGKLEIESKFPTFREQLFEDYPGIKRIIIKFEFYLLNDSAFYRELQKCGYSALSSFTHVKHSLERVLQREEVNQPDNSIKILFDKEELKQFKNSPYVTVFCKLSIKFIENEEDEYNISLNQKFTEVPFFVLTIKNDEFAGGFSWLFYLLIFVMVFAFLYVLKIKLETSQDRDIIKSDIQYQRGDKIEGTKIEMS